MVTHVGSHPLFEGLQQSVVLFILGAVVAIIIEALEWTEGFFGRSYVMWMSIEPHLMLCIMLPPLVTGDAMNIDTTVAKRVGMQCLFLAGPGVCISAFLTAFFLYFYLPSSYDWSFLLCLTSGAILCATDPVAVVGLLKELGASPTLTVQIQGESLLNDGTAIVLYMISYQMLGGKSYDSGDIIIFLVKMAMYALGFGMLIGWLFFAWIRMANSKLHHHSSVIQVSLTICCAYSSFIIAELAFKISGVLATVAAALVLAHKMWPEVSNKESMHSVWHMLEYLGNTVIFFLAGALTGKNLLKIQWQDYFHLLVIYAAVTFIRGSLFFSARPLLTYLNADKQAVTLEDACVMTWGGLRGAIGLALAIQVSVERAGGKISEANADRVLFYVSGIAALTLVVNATTCPMLVRRLGITQMPATKRKMLSLINRQMLMIVRSRTKPRSHVRKVLQDVLGEVEHEIQEPHTKGEFAREALHHLQRRHSDITNTKKLEIGTAMSIRGEETNIHRGSLDEPTGVASMASSASIVPRQMSSASGLAGKLVSGLAKELPPMQEPQQLVDQLQEAKSALEKVENWQLPFQLLGHVPDIPLLDQEAALIELVSLRNPRLEVQRAVNEAFLHLVNSEYWSLIEHGDFFGSEAEQILASINTALSQSHYDLLDFSVIEPFIQMKLDDSAGRVSDAVKITGIKTMGPQSSSPQSSSSSVRMVPTATRGQTAAGQAARFGSDPLWAGQRVHRLVENLAFNAAIAVSIFANASFTMIEQESRKDNEKGLGWLIPEITFTVIFTVECTLKIIDEGLKYFNDAWHVFDFFLVLTGLIGCIFAIMVYDLDERTSGSGDIPTSEARLIRGAQIFRMMRIVRLFRLYRLVNELRANLRGKSIKVEIAEHMHKTTILASFALAHMRSQEKLVCLFGLDKKVDTPEVARCILQSQVSVYKAISMAQYETRTLDQELLDDVCTSQEGRIIVERCQEFLHSALSSGVISPSEAESMEHPMTDQVRLFHKCISARHKGGVEAGSQYLKAAYQARSQSAHGEFLDFDAMGGINTDDNIAERWAATAHLGGSTDQICRVPSACSSTTAQAQMLGRRHLLELPGRQTPLHQQAGSAPAVEEEDFAPRQAIAANIGHPTEPKKATGKKKPKGKRWDTAKGRDEPSSDGHRQMARYQSDAKVGKADSRAKSQPRPRLDTGTTGDSEATPSMMQTPSSVTSVATAGTEGKRGADRPKPKRKKAKSTSKDSTEQSSIDGPLANQA